MSDNLICIKVEQPDIDDTLAEEEVYEIVEFGIDDAFVDGRLILNVIILKH